MVKQFVFSSVRNIASLHLSQKLPHTKAYVVICDGVFIMLFMQCFTPEIIS